jgi:arginyl-tRNA synthetase
MKEQLSSLLLQAIEALKSQGLIAPDVSANINLERTKSKEHGDLATNLALSLAKAAKMPPRDLAAKIVANIPSNSLIRQADIAGPGFINFFLAEAAATAVIQQILLEKQAFGTSKVGAGAKVQVEFVSANPTGPLHIGHGRGAAVGDSLCRLLGATGWDVSSEFYYNDAGVQIHTLTVSTQARAKGLSPGDPDWPEDAGYFGEYINDVAQDFLAKKTVTAKDITVTANGDINDTHAIQQFAVAYLRQEQDLDLQAFAVDFDVYFLESSLYADGSVENTVENLVVNGQTYEKDSALWLKTTDYGDDKDRVMRKSEGGFTYFVPDVAYHRNKFERGFTRVINEQGADHHSTITRVRAGLQALNVGIPENWPEYVLHQMVLVTKGGEEVKISKRAGSYVTLRDLIDEVGRDATRYFLVSRRTDAQLTFDIDLAKSQSNDNPVYYIQYAHARCASVMRKLEEQGLTYATEDADLGVLTEDTEKALLKTLAFYPEMIDSAAQRLEPHLVANYLRELAGEYHSFYNAHKVIVDEENIRNARIALSLAVKQVIQNGLDILGVSAPDKM